VFRQACATGPGVLPVSCRFPPHTNYAFPVKFPPIEVFLGNRHPTVLGSTRTANVLNKVALSVDR
jgi:hypothetical protein